MDDPLHRRLHELPKIDLHRHLEGSLRLSTLAEIARTHRLDLPGYSIPDFRHLVQMVPSDENSADVFISKFAVLRQFFRSPEIIERVTYEAVADAAADNVVYLELRFTPIALARQMDFPLADVVSRVIGAARRAEQDFGIGVRLIISMNRHESVALGDQFVDLAIANRDRGVVGVDLAGAENHFAGAPFAPVFRRAREAGLNVTIHAGEWAGPESVVEAVEVLGAQRLGHGVQVSQAPAVVSLIRERGIALEMCLTSNLQSGVIPALADHPLPALAAAGVLTTINTDDPGVSAISLTGEYVVAIRDLGLSVDGLKQQIINAARVSFLPEPERRVLVEQIAGQLYPEEENQP